MRFSRFSTGFKTLEADELYFINGGSSNLCYMGNGNYTTNRGTTVTTVYGQAPVQDSGNVGSVIQSIGTGIKEGGAACAMSGQGGPYGAAVGAIIYGTGYIIESVGKSMSN